MSNKRFAFISNKMYHEGLSDEQFTMDALRDSIGGTCRRSTKQEDINDHIDFWWTTPKGNLIPIDAKGLHRDKRGDKTYSENHWIEVKNVKGNYGWIYGKASFISFRTPDEILFVEPIRLIKLYKDYVVKQPIQRMIPKACFIPYQRKGRKDLIFKVPNDYLKKLSTFIIKLK